MGPSVCSCEDLSLNSWYSLTVCWIRRPANPRTQRADRGIPTSGWLGRLAGLANSAFKWEILPQPMRWQAVREDTSSNLWLPHIFEQMCTHRYTLVWMCTPTNDTWHNTEREDRVASPAGRQEDRGSGLWRIPAGHHPVCHLRAPCFVPRWEVQHFSMHQEAMDFGSPAVESPPNVELEGQYSSLSYSVPQGVQQAITWHPAQQGS